MIETLQKIYISGVKLLEPLTLEATYTTVVKEATKLVNASYGSLTLRVNDDFQKVYSTLPVQIRRRKKGFTFRAFKERKVLIVDAEQTPGFYRLYPDYKKLNIKSIVLIPLFYRQEAIGVLAINSKKKEHFSKKQLGILQLFGSLATLAIRKNQLYEETKKALETRDLFISMAAHELRTPLTSISGYIQLLKGRINHFDQQEARWIEQLYGENIRLTGLVNELLEMNRIRSGQLQYILRECNLRKIIEIVQNNFLFSYPDRQLIIEDNLGQNSDIVIGDPDKIIQVFNNLLDNAVKFSPSSEPILLILRSKNINLVVQVKDQGIGIDKKDIDSIFKGFHQGNHNKEGLGLGLFLVKDIVKRLHGNIKVYSRLNKGTTMEITLPGAQL